mgnify:CR=1 FL=1
MNVETFNQIVEKRIEKTRELLVRKGKQYAADGDRLTNFKSGAAFQGNTPEQCWLGYVTKHLTSLSILVRSNSKDKAAYDEVIGDVIVYMHLLEGLVLEHGEAPSPAPEPEPAPAPEQPQDAESIKQRMYDFIKSCNVPLTFNDLLSFTGVTPAYLTLLVSDEKFFYKIPGGFDENPMFSIAVK